MSQKNLFTRGDFFVILINGGLRASDVAGAHTVLDTQPNEFDSRLVHHYRQPCERQGCFYFKPNKTKTTGNLLAQIPNNLESKQVSGGSRVSSSFVILRALLELSRMSRVSPHRDDRDRARPRIAVLHDDVLGTAALPTTWILDEAACDGFLPRKKILEPTTTSDMCEQLLLTCHGLFLS